MDKTTYRKNTGLAFSRNKNLLCTICSQIFYVRDPLHPRGLRSPLVLHCGHSACEKCVRAAVNDIGRVICGVCKQISTATQNKTDLREDFPLNLYLLGIYAFRHWGQEPEDSKVAFVPAGASFTGHKTSVSSLKVKEHKKELCLECRSRDAECKCQQCEGPYCGQCFAKVHQAARALSKHVKCALDSSSQEVISSICDIHAGQKLEFFCNECATMVCSHCVICIHQGHSVITKRQKNEEGIAELDEARESALDVMKRLMHTQKKLDKVLMIPMPGSNVSLIEQEVMSHFTFLHGTLQLLEEKIMSTIQETKNRNSQNLESLRNEVQTNIQNVKDLIQESDAAKVQSNLDKVEVSEITKRLKEIQNLPCHLMSEERTSNPLISFEVDDTFLQLFESHCELEIQELSSYKLVKTEDLPPNIEIESIEDETEQDAVASVSSHTSSTSASESLKSGLGSVKQKRGAYISNITRNKKKTTLDIVKGSTDIVTVCHVRNPSSFYVHRTSDGETVLDLSNKLSKHAGSFSTPPDSVMINGLYIVQYSHDKKWYRARVKSIEPSSGPETEDKVNILYIDYGNTEIVPVSRLRCIPPRFAHIKTLALHCSLFGITPINGKWSQESVKCLAVMLDGAPVKMYVMDYTPDIYHVDLCQIQGQIYENDVPVSVRDALVFLEHACFLGEENFKVSAVEKNLQFFRERDFRRGTIMEVVVSHVESPHDFYVQRLGDHARYLCSLMQDMNKEYTNSENRGLIYKPQIGMPCAAEYTQDQRWYRAKVVGIPGNKMVKVFYVDYGNQEVLPWNKLRKLQPQFLRIAAQGINCSMTDIVPKEQQWTQDVAEHMKEVTREKMLRLYVDEIQQSKLKVTLYDSQEDVDICINALLVRDGYAIGVGVSSSLVEYHKKNGLPLTVPPVSLKIHPTKSTKKNSVRNVRTQNTGVDYTSQTKSSQEPIEVAAVEDTFRLQVRVLRNLSPSCIYVTLMKQEQQIQSLMCDLQEFYAGLTSTVDKWEVNDKCCAFSVKHKAWYRAIIIELLPDDQAKVFLKDFAEVETVPVLNLQLLDTKFLKVRDGAITCHLVGVRAAGDKQEWPTLACEYLSELIDKYHNIYITKKGAIENSSLPVELWVKNIIQGGPLDPTREEWITLNKKLIEQGLAIPVRNISEDKNIPSLHQELDEQTQDVTKNNVSEWLKLSSQTEGSMKTESSDPAVETNDDFNMSDIDEAAVEEEAAAISPEITNWLPPLPIKKREFTATPTFVDNECFIYLHDTKQSSDTLTVISNALHSRFKNSQPKPHDQYWFPKQLCIAQYHSDKRWYRGKVLQVNEDDRIVKVRFVDYGNVEECRASELRKNIYMTHIPIQCYKCCLHGIKAATEDGKWPIDVLDFLHVTIVEKQCRVTIMEEPRLGKPYEIKLIGPGNIDIGELLVNVQFALYCGGFGAVSSATLQSDNGTEDDSVIIENEDQLEENEIKDGGDHNKDKEIQTQVKTESESTTEEYETHKNEEPLTSTEHFEKESSLVSNEHVKWTDLIEMEEKQEQLNKKEEENDFRYKKLELTENETLLVEATTILAATMIVVHPLSSENSRITEVKEKFKKVSEEMQKFGRKQPLIRNPYIGQPCCACYAEDDRWYRAAIIAIEEKESRVKVQYVDYGNVEFLKFNKVHKLKPEWAEVPMMGLTCKLWNIEKPQEWNKEKLFSLLMRCLFQPPLVANVKVLHPVMEVELLTEDQSLVCQPLLDEGLLVKKDEEDQKAEL